MALLKPPGTLHSITVAAKHPRVEIEYCTQCRWLLRAAWMAQELLTTFQDEIGELVLMPAIGGVFEVRIEYMVALSARPLSRDERTEAIGSRSHRPGS